MRPIADAQLGTRIREHQPRKHGSGLIPDGAWTTPDRQILKTDLLTRAPESLNGKGRNSPLLSMDSALRRPPRTSRFGLKTARSVNVASTPPTRSRRSTLWTCCKRSLRQRCWRWHPSPNRNVDRYRDEPQVIGAQQTERPRGTFVAHKNEKCCSTESASVNQPRTKWPIASVPSRF